LALPELDALMLAGGYPAIHAHAIAPGDWLAAWLLGIRDTTTLALHPLRGALFGH
jgi:hypothetical protein